MGAAFGATIGAAVTKHPVGAGIGAVVGATGGASKLESGAKTTMAIRRFDSDDSGIVSKEERLEALKDWQADYDATAGGFERMTGQTYRLPPGTTPTSHAARRTMWWKLLPAGTVDGSAVDTNLSRDSPECARLVTQLADAVASQSSFVGRILALGPKVVDDVTYRYLPLPTVTYRYIPLHTAAYRCIPLHTTLGPKVIDDEWIDRGVTRYAEFLRLAKEHPGETVCGHQRSPGDASFPPGPSAWFERAAHITPRPVVMSVVHSPSRVLRAARAHSRHRLDLARAHAVPSRLL